VGGEDLESAVADAGTVSRKHSGATMND